MSKDELRVSIKQARDRYYNDGDSGIEDAVYDDWVEQYRALIIAEGLNPDEDDILNPDVVGADVTTEHLGKAEHRTFMGSLDNSMNEQQFRAFDKRVGGPYFINPKYDGASIALYYEKGKLVQALTRGNGKIGDDITNNALKFKNVPATVPGSFSGAIRGEAILFTAEWLKLDPDRLGNPRNIGSGIIQRSDGTQSDLMRFMAFDINPDGYEPKTEKEKEDLLTGLGFEVYAGRLIPTGEEVIKEHKEFEAHRQNLPFWVDGLVVKANSVARQKELGISGKRPRSQTAYKFLTEKAKTKLLEVIWTVGHQGDQIPTGRFTPVRLGGTTVENALLCNMEEIARLDIAVGDEVEIYKAGEIIPKVFQVVSRPKDRKPIEEQKVCVVCGSPTQRRVSSDKKNKKIGAVTECTNHNCEAKSFGKLSNFIKKIDVLEVGDAVLTAMVDSGMVTTIPDLYRLNVDKLAELKAGNKVGKSRAEKIVKNFQDKRKLTIDLFLGSLGIRHLGRRKTQIIRENVEAKTGLDIFNRLPAWLDGKLVQYKDQAGVPGVAEVIQVSIDRMRNMIDDLLTEVTIVDPPKKAAPKTGLPLSGKNFCLTGTMSRKRNLIAADIEAAGGKVFDKVVADVILVQADPNSESSKSKSIRKMHPNDYDQWCIDEATLMKMMK